MTQQTKKRIAICMDGTWQQLRQDRKTNIGIIARSIAQHDPAANMPQIVIYTQGVGSTIGAMKKAGQSRIGALAAALGSFAGGAFGEGLEDSILDTYLRLAFNYEPGDEIYIFGFSRGAFSARSLAALIGRCGIVSRRFAEKAIEAFDIYRTPGLKWDDPICRDFRTKFGKRITDKDGVRRNADFRPPIAYLGIFDTVGQRGLPSALGWLSEKANERFSFHDLDLGAHVLAARHALAIDERRAAFPPTLWTNLDAMNELARDLNPHLTEPLFEQRWFSGWHGDIGGGARSTLSVFPLTWVVEGAEKAGLTFDVSDTSPLMYEIKVSGLNPSAPLSAPTNILDPLNWGARWRPIAPDLVDGKEADLVRTRALLSEAVALRTVSPRLEKPYAPPTLKPFAAAMRQIALPALVVQAAVRLVAKKPPPPTLWMRIKRWLGLR
jgi:uncharacterized protein (DUF2235 family)